MKYLQKIEVGPRKLEIEIRKSEKWVWWVPVSLKRDFGGQSCKFDPMVKNTVKYRLFMIQNIAIQTSCRNTVIVNNNLYGSYRVSFYS